MIKPDPASQQWDERPNAAVPALSDSGSMFRLLFEHSADAMSLFDPETGRFVESNDAVARQVGAPNRASLGNASPAEISPERQPDGRLSSDKAAEMIKLAMANGSHRFEWLSKSYAGHEIPLDIVMTRVSANGKAMLFVVSRDISGQKEAEQEIRRLNASLEQRVAERTVELVRTNEQLKEEIAVRRRQEVLQRKRSEQVQRHRDVLLELAQKRSPDFAQALEKICAFAAETLDVARVSYWPLGDDNSSITCELLYLRAQKTTDAATRGARLEAGHCPDYFAALTSHRPIVANDVFTHPATRNLGEEYLRPRGITSMLDAPVWVRGEVVGVLCHEHIGPAREWSPEEVDFASALATMVCLAVEESQRARSEHLLRESEEKFRALFEGTSQAVVLHDETGIFEANPSWLKMFGYSSITEVAGKFPWEVSPPIQPGGERAEVLAARHMHDAVTKGSARFEWMIRRKDGREVPIEVFLTNMLMGHRRVIQAVCNDISERKMAEALLRDSEARLRDSEARFGATFRASPVSITVSRVSDRRYVMANEAFLKWTGFDLEEVQGRNSLDLDLWEDADEREKFWEEVARTGFIRGCECRVRSRDNKQHTLLLCADVIQINRENHLLTVGLDITQRKEAEAELLKTLAREKELGLLRSKFVSMVSHEFRTPLGIIQSSAEILQDYLERLDPAARDEHLLSIRNNTRRMATLMEEVLLIGSFDAGRMEFKPAEMDLGRFARRLVDEVGSATEFRCFINLSLHGLCNCAHADERLVSQILTNLLTNAVKYSEPGRLVSLSIAHENNEAVCVIRDEGIGIPEEDREWLFHAFHRGGNVGDRPGTGLGLVIVKRSVDLHGGTIKFDSAVGSGTTVTVRLPVFPETTGSPPP